MTAVFRVNTDLVLDTGKTEPAGIILTNGTDSMNITDRASVSEIADDGTITVTFNTEGENIIAGETYTVDLTLTYTDLDGAIENWKSDAEVSIEVPRDLVSPKFTDISTEHIKNEDADEPDQFDYGFSIELNDADTAQPLTVKLQYTGVDGDDWTDAVSEGSTVNTMAYAGEADIWDGTLTYDMIPLLEEFPDGFIRQVRIVCDYTLTDGTEGTIYSTDIGKLYAYTGNYLEPVSGEYAEGVMTAVFRVNTDLVHDRSGIETVGVTVTGNTDQGTWDITDRASVSEIADDGTITVTFNTEGENIIAGETYTIGLTLTYNDLDGAIEDWKSDAEVSIEVPRDLVSPTFTDISTEHIKNEDTDEPDQFDYGFSIELNDADTAQPLTVRLQYTTVDGDDWTDVNSQGNTINALTYDGDTDTWNGTLTYDMIPLLEEFPDGFIRQVRIVCDYTLTDGTEGTIYSTDIGKLYAYTGNYLEPVSGEYTDGVMTAVFRVNTDLVRDRSGIDTVGVTVTGNTDQGTWDITDRASVSEIADDGTITVTFNTEGENIIAGETFTIGLTLNYNNSDSAIENWKSDAEVSIEVPRDLVSPTFTELSTEHTEREVDDITDLFDYGFSIELNDADTAQPLTVKLQYTTVDGDDWTDAVSEGSTVNTLTYDGDTGTWNGILTYDMIPLRRQFSPGLVRQVRIVCDYKLTDGTEGTIYSTDIGKLYAYTGNYLEPVSGEYSDGVMTAVFKVNTDMVLNTARLETEAVVLYGNPDAMDVTDRVSVSEAAADGTITVTFNTEGENIIAGETYSLGLTLAYNDLDGGISDWKSQASQEITVAREPVGPAFTAADMERAHYGSVEGIFADTFHYGFTIELNDTDITKPVTVRLQYGSREGEGWTDCLPGRETVNTLTYDGTGSEWTSELAYDLSTLEVQTGAGLLRKIRIVCDYTLTDGTEGTIYSTEIRDLYAYTGDYLHAESAELADGVLTAVFSLDTSLVLDVSSGKYTVDELILTTGSGDDGWKSIRDEAAVEFGTDGRITVTYTLQDGEVLDPAADHMLGMSLIYNDLDGVINDWDSYDSIDFEVPRDLVPPAFAELSTDHIKTEEAFEDDAADQFEYGFYIELNDADTSQPLTVKLQYTSVDGDDWTDAGAEGDTLTYEGDTGSWSGTLTYDMMQLLGEYPDGFVRQVRIVCDYTLTDGTEGTIYSTEIGRLYAYTGDYLEPVSGEYANGAMTAVFKVNTDLVLDTAKLETESVELGGSLEQGYWEITGKAAVSEADSEGIITVTFNTEGENIIPGQIYNLVLTLTYNDLDGGIEDWKSWADTDIEVPRDLTGPAFTSLDMEHAYNPGIDEVYMDQFRYGFSIDLNDADITKPVTVRLQYGTREGSEWTDCPADGETVNTLTFDATGSEWTSALIYDVYPLWPEDGEGWLRQIRIVCDYTLTDGTSGTVYSTDTGTLYAYAGDYLHPESAVLEDGVLRAVYTLDTDLVLDTSAEKYTVSELTLWHGYGLNDSKDVSDLADVSFGTDGRVTVTYIMQDDDDMDPDNSHWLGMELLYNDMDGMISGWASYAAVDFEVPRELIAPAFAELDAFRNYDPSDDSDDIEQFEYSYYLELNDADPSMPLTVRLQYADYGGDEWTDVPVQGRTVSTMTFEGDTSYWADSLTYDMIPLHRQYAPGFIRQVRIACDYTLKDGSQGTVYSTDAGNLYAYMGNYLEAVSGEFADGALTAVFRVNQDLVLNTDKLETAAVSVYGYEEAERRDVTEHASVSEVSDEGTITVSLPAREQNILPGGSYMLYLTLAYNDLDGAIEDWQSEAQQFISVPEQNNPPGFVEASSQRIFESTPEGSETDRFEYRFLIELNDADTAQPPSVRLQYAPLNSDEWTDAPALGATVSTLTFEEGSSRWSDTLIYDMEPLRREFYPGFIRQVRIACDYTMGDGTSGTVYSTEIRSLYAYTGRYLQAVSGEYANGFMTGVYQVNLDMVPEPALLETESVILYGGSDPLDVTDSADVSAAADDGRITVTVDTRGENITAGQSYYLGLTLNYNDQNREITGWQCAASTEINVPQSLTPPAFVELDGNRVLENPVDYPEINQFDYDFYLELYDADPAVPPSVTLQYAGYGSDEWADVAAQGNTVSTMTFDGDTDYWSGVLVYDMMPMLLQNVKGLFRQVRIACAYTLKDGTSGTVYSTDLGRLYAYAGEYLEGMSAVYGNGTLRAEFRVDTEILPAELLGSLSLSEAYINTEDGYQDITADAVISSADEDGMITLTCTFPNGLPPSSYQNFIVLQLSCDDSEYPVVNWTSSGSVTFEIP